MHSEGSDQTADGQADLSLRWAHTHIDDSVLSYRGSNSFVYQFSLCYGRLEPLSLVYFYYVFDQVLSNKFSNFWARISVKCKYEYRPGKLYFLSADFNKARTKKIAR